MSLKAAFLFLAGDAQPHKHRQAVSTGSVTLTVIAVKDYEDAEVVAKALIEQGVVAIELWRPREDRP